MNRRALFSFRFFVVLFSGLLFLSGCKQDDWSGSDTSGTAYGEVSVSFDFGSAAAGSGTEESPLEISGNDTLSLSLLQNNIYHTPDGKVHTCAPEATVRAYAALDTVFVSDVSELSSVTASPSQTKGVSGSDPVCHTLSQSFQIGSQSLCYDMGYEVYSIREASGVEQELPYVRPVSVAMSGTGTEETDGVSSEGGVRSVAVSVLPLDKGRALVRDTAWYAVTVRSVLKLEAVHADSAKLSDLVFEHHYVGAVVRDLKVPNPQTGALSYTLSHEGGSGSCTAADPGVIGPGEALTLTISQKSVYTEVDGTVIERAPRAVLKLHAAQDTVYAASLEALKAQTAEPVTESTQTGDTLVRYITNQKYSVGGQSVYFDLEHQVNRYTTKDGETIDMPYVAFSGTAWGGQGVTPAASDVKVVRSAVSVKPLPVSRAIQKDTALYEVRATFSVALETAKTEEQKEQTLVFEVRYVGAVVTETEVPDPEPNLVKVVYRTGYEWEEAHDNLPLAYYAHVYRERHYDNKEVITDRFVDLGHLWTLGASMGPTDAKDYEFIDGSIGTYYDYYQEFNDSVFYGYGKLVVDNIDNLSYKLEDDCWHTSLPDEWDKYVEGKRYDDELIVAVDNSLCDQGWSKTKYPSGWYFKDCARFRRISLYYGGDLARSYDMTPCWYEQYLVIDGLRIDFIDWRPKLTYSFTHKDIPASGSSPRCRVYTYQCHSVYYNRNFYINLIDSIIERR